MNKDGVGESDIINVGNRPDGVNIPDLNGNGENDIAVANYDDNDIMILFKK